MVPDSTHADLDALQAVCDRLAGFDARISIEWLDGCMAALVCAPRRPTFDEWIPRLLDDTWERTFADPDDVRQATAALQRRLQVLARQLDPDALLDDPERLRLAPLLLAAPEAPLQDEIEMPPAGHEWACGFLDVVDAFAADWVAPDPAGEGAWFHDALAAIVTLSADDPSVVKARLALRHPGRTLSRDDLIDEACFGAQDLRCWWVEHAPKPAPRQVDKVPGRNDPCPCGSGRKYKKCHGAAAAGG